jgi:hypothetical protein
MAEEFSWLENKMVGTVFDRASIEDVFPEQVWLRVPKGYKPGSKLAEGLTACCARPFPLYNSGPLDRVVFQNQVPEQVWHRLLKNHKVGSAVAAGLTSCCAMPFPLYNSGPEGDVYEDRHNIFKSPKYLSGPSAERNTEPCCENSNGT